MKIWFAAALSVAVSVLTSPGTVRYVAPGSPSPTPGYTNWLTAAHILQEAVGMSTNGDTVLVSNGFYSVGGALVPSNITSNRVVVSVGVTVRSVNGPDVTTIAGAPDPFMPDGLGSNAVRCAAVDGGVLAGFTLTSGYTRNTPNNVGEKGGGGVFIESGTVSNCIIRNCHADNTGGGVLFYFGNGLVHACTISDSTAVQSGGGATFNGGSGRLESCVIISNSATIGGGVSCFGGSGIYNCTIVSNTANWGGGLRDYFNSPVVNTIIYYNTGTSGSNEYYGTSDMSYSCTRPLPSGSGNFTNAPLFYDPANRDVHLRADSPCIGAGTNILLSLMTDIDGQPRVFGSHIDVGADEAVIEASWITTNGSGRSSHWLLPPHIVYKLETSTDPAGTNWWNLSGTWTSMFPSVTISDSSSDPLRRYRIRWVGP
ncbi:MAG: right-handed parallel beta-helix repeat-containing protein [Verrucomicrobia bacterium]|nr:right-handed parallel beta-helix repeat-containing protein [Verrucomicrobiota bacterium]